MEAFLTAKQRARRLEDYLRRRDPVRGRFSNTERMRIVRALSAIAERIDYWLEETDYQPMKGWLPYESVVTARDDDYVRDFFAAYREEDKIDEDGYLRGFHDPGIKATNKIIAVTWYKNAINGEFLLAKPVYSPLPCSEWGRLPLTLTQWRLVAPQLIGSMQLWQWLHAVRHYLSDETFEIGGFMGWHFSETQKTVNLSKIGGYLFDARDEEDQAKDATGWTGHIIYKHITDEFSLHVNGASGTPCQQ